MAMSERELLKGIFPYRKWWLKVDKMSDGQVHATLIRLRKEGKAA